MYDIDTPWYCTFLKVIKFVLTLRSYFTEAICYFEKNWVDRRKSSSEIYAESRNTELVNDYWFMRSCSHYSVTPRLSLSSVTPRLSPSSVTPRLSSSLNKAVKKNKQEWEWWTRGLNKVDWRPLYGDSVLRNGILLTIECNVQLPTERSTLNWNKSEGWIPQSVRPQATDLHRVSVSETSLFMLQIAD